MTDDTPDYIDPHPEMTRKEKEEARERIRALLTPENAVRLSEQIDAYATLYERAQRRRAAFRVLAAVMVCVLILAVGVAAFLA